MTYKEKLREIKPECINDSLAGGCVGCPSDHFNFCDAPRMNRCGLPAKGKCERCWNSEMPEELKEPKNDGTINGLPRIEKRSETLIVGIDHDGEGFDGREAYTITIAKLEGVKMVVNRVIRGEAARDLYDILTS